MTDSIQVIWEYLTVSGTTLNALVGTRLWSPEAPVTWRNETAGVVYELLDEDKGALPKNSCLVTFRCYGGKRADGSYRHGDARAVYLALNERLSTADGTTTNGGTILLCEQTTGSQSFGEDETEWPVVETQYRFEIE